MMDDKRYRVYKANNKIIVVSSYAGKAVRGVAKCNPDDNFFLEDGIALAKARCDVKIARKRSARATQKMLEADKELTKAKEYFNKMYNYHVDSYNALDKALDNLDEIIDKLK